MLLLVGGGGGAYVDIDVCSGIAGCGGGGCGTRTTTTSPPTHCVKHDIFVHEAFYAAKTMELCCVPANLKYIGFL